jgi:transposase
MLYAGLDVHKNFCQAIVMTKDGELVKEGRIKSEKEDIQRFFSSLENVEVAFEASGNYEYYYDILDSLGYKVHLSHPLKTRLIADARIKTDKIDAKAIADLLRGDLLPTSYVPPEKIRRIRHLVRHRIALGHHRTKLKNQIHAVLRRKNLKYQGQDTFTGNGIKWLRSLNNSEIDSYLAIFETVVREIKSVDRDINTESMNHKEIKLLTTIPGIGPYSAMLIFSEIGNIHRFNSEEKLFSYAGLIPRIHQSGENGYHGRITKEGSKYLRWILVEAVQVHIRYAPESKITYHYYRVKKKRPNNVAKVAAARKLLQAIYHMLKNEDEFRG